MINNMNEMVNNFTTKLNPNDTSPKPVTGYILLWETVSNWSKTNLNNYTDFLQKKCLSAREHVLTCTPQFQRYECELIILISITEINCRDCYNA